MKFTVFGGSGFIGKNLIKYLNGKGYEVYAPSRTEIEEVCDLGVGLGHVIYCIGMTADFRENPSETIYAHVCLLNKLLFKCQNKSFTFLSSTRLYSGSDNTQEDSLLQVSPYNPEDLYNISKLMGESLCLNAGSTIKIIRISNVYGADASSSFLADIIHDAINYGRVTFHTSPQSQKDYISINDVVNLITNITLNGKHRIYNVASGANVTNLDIAFSLEEIGIKCNFLHDPKTWSFPVIDIRRIKDEFDCHFSNVIDDVQALIENYSKNS